MATESKQPSATSSAGRIPIRGAGGDAKPMARTGVMFNIRDTEFLLKMFAKGTTFAGAELEQGSETLTKVKAIHEDLMKRVYEL